MLKTSPALGEGRAEVPSSSDPLTPEIATPPVRWPLAPLTLTVCVVAAGWYSLRELGGLALSETPVAFTAVVPLLAAYLLWHDARRQPAADARRSDVFVDGIAFAVLMAAALYLILFLPAQLSWYYWLQRFDLLVLPLAATAVALAGWGTGGALVVKRSLGFLLLAWPLPLVLIQQTLGPVLTYLSAAYGHLVVALVGLPITIPRDDFYRFVSTGPEQFTIIIADVCSGMNALLGFLIVGLPAVMTSTGTRSGKLGWLLTGMALAWSSNFIRLTVLLVLATTAGADFTLGTLHPILGAALFALVVVVMLMLRPRFGLGATPAPVIPWDDSQLAAPFRRGSLVAIAPAIALLATGQLILTQFGPLNSESIPAIRVREASALLPELPGWNRELRDQISWQNLFGRDSQSRLLRYRSESSGSMVVQFVATPDKRLLESYSPEKCDLFHGERIVGVSTVNLGYGLSAHLVESHIVRPGEADLAAATLYWFMPVQLDDQLYHARIALLADTEMLGTVREPRPAPAEANPLADLPAMIASRLQPYPAARNAAEFAALDEHVLGFGRSVVSAIMEKN